MGDAANIIPAAFISQDLYPGIQFRLGVMGVSFSILLQKTHEYEDSMLATMLIKLPYHKTVFHAGCHATKAPL